MKSARAWVLLPPGRRLDLLGTVGREASLEEAA
jgi:hypothetical protein